MINIVMTTSLYDDLELPKTCTSEEIKQKYRILAQLHHPDKGGDVEKFKRMKLAYEVLSDPIKREHYDSTGDHYNDINLDSEVMGRLAVMVSQFVQHINPEFDDLILKMKIEIRALQQLTTNAIVECNDLIAKFNIISKKIRLKKEGENLLKLVVDKKVLGLHNEVINHKRGLIVFARMLEVLDDYHYSSDEWRLLLENVDGPA
jgi:curved DNA-binding protein CbpA